MSPRNKFKLLPDGQAVIYVLLGGAEHATLIDAADLPRALALGRWYAQKRSWTLYAACTYLSDGKRRTVRLHRFLTDCPDGLEVDHIDHDGLNNTRSNLRLVTPEANKASARPWGEGQDVDRWYEAGCKDAWELAGYSDFPF